VALYVDGALKVAHGYSGSLCDGKLGLVTQNALAHFDDVLVQEYVPPPPPPSATLPLEEDFEDGVADYFEPVLGTWEVAGARYSVTPQANQDGISTLRIEGPMPANLEYRVTMNAEGVSTGRLSNAFLVFDYQGPTDFKFAGSFVGIDHWTIGRRTGSGWYEDAVIEEPVDALVDYALRLVIENDSDVALYVDGALKVAHGYSGSLCDGKLGLVTQNALAHFDDVIVEELVGTTQVQGALAPPLEAYDARSAANLESGLDIESPVNLREDAGGTAGKQPNRQGEVSDRPNARGTWKDPLTGKLDAWTESVDWLLAADEERWNVHAELEAAIDGCLAEIMGERLPY